MAAIGRLFGSFGLTVACLLLLALLTLLGTLAQIENGLFDAQRLYFDSWIVLHPVRYVNVPLPGGQLVMTVLFANLIVGGMVRIRRSKRLLGVYVTHIGMALLLVAGVVKLYFADEGYMALYEGDAANYFESHYHWELALRRQGEQREFVLGDEALAGASDSAVAVRHSDLPFAVVVDRYVPNSRVGRDGGSRLDVATVDGFYLERLAPAKEKEHNMPGAYVTLESPAGERLARGLLWFSNMRLPAAWEVEVQGTTWEVELRPQRFPLPFRVRLDDFRKDDHPGISMARAFESDITQFVDGDERQVLIEMNAPLRDSGYVLFQSGWGPQNARPNQILYSQFSVVRNPSDHWPLVACIVIAIGMMFHFGSRLLRHVEKEMQVA